MLVVEDTLTNEMHRLFVVDAAIQLGSIDIGTQHRDFNPLRALKFFGLVDEQLHEFSSKYPDSFRYIPRRAYDYLRTPPILGEIYHGFPEYSNTSWLIDQFFVHSLLDVGKSALPRSQQESNIKKAKGWTETPPFGPRLYHVQEMRYGHQSKPGWACVLRASDLGSVLSGPNRNDLLNHINEGSPIYIELEGKGDLNALLEWLVFLKDAGVRTPIVLLAVINHRDWGEEIVRLLDIPGSRLLTSGSTIGSLSTIVSYLRNKGESWSNRLIFASSYPETQIGESLSEILSYFLSKGLGATSDDLQRILGGNLISLLPPRPRFLKYIINESTVAAEGLLGKTSMNELSRILRILATRGIQQVLSCDFMPLRNGAEIDLRSAVLTVKESTSNEANSLGLLSERNESLRVAGWMNTFKETLVERKADLLLSLIRTSTKAGGPILNSPSQLNRFNYSLLECLKVRNPHEILSALHFEVQIGDNLRGSISIHPDDLVALESADNQLLIGLEATTGQWWASKASSHPECPTRTVQLSREDARVLGIKELAVIDLVKYEGEVQDLQKARLAFNSDNASASELMAYIHLHHEEIEGTLNEFYLGRGTTLSFGGPFSVKMTLANTEPPLEQGQVGILNSERIILHPDQFYQPMNVVLCISTDSSMQEKDIELRAMEAFRRSLQDVKWDVPELNQFLDSIGSQPTRAQISALAALLVLSGLSGNRTDGRLALVTYSDRARKFSVQKADRLLNYIEFATDFASEEVLVSILYSILDTVDETGGKSKPAAMFRSIAEILEEFGTERPTLVILITGQITDETEESIPFIRAISALDRYQFDIFNFGEFDIGKAKETLRGINARIFPVHSFSGHVFEGYLIDAIERLSADYTERFTEYDFEDSQSH